MTGVNIYLTFNGNCEEAFLFYQSIFGGEFQQIGRFSEIPPSEDLKIAESDLNRIMHISYPIGNSILMGSDNTSEYSASFLQGNNYSIALGLESREEADRVFAALSAGGQVTMPLSVTFWNAYFGMVTDKFGIQWMVNYDLPALS